MTTPDCKAMPDAELEELRVAVLEEQFRRRNLERIPQDIKELMEQYEAAGGDPGELPV